MARSIIRHIEVLLPSGSSATASVARDVRLTGQQSSATGLDFRITGVTVPANKILVHQASRRAYRAARARRKPQILRSRVTPLQSPRTVSLITSGNEITDSTRFFGQQGDGLPGADLVTNLIQNSGFETNKNGWSNFSGSDGGTRSTTQARTGVASLRVVASGTAAAQVQGKNVNATNIPVVAGQSYSASAYVLNDIGVRDARVGIRFVDGSGALINQSFGNIVTLTSSWQQVTMNNVVAGAGSVAAFVIVNNNATGATGDAFFVDDVQLENSAQIHALVPTDGATASSYQGTPDSSFGIWEGVTNQLSNGGFETNTTGWNAISGGETITRDATVSKFGGASGKIVGNGSLANQGFYHETATGLGLVANFASTASIWVNAPAGTDLRLRHRIFNTDASTNDADFNFNATGDWQRVTVTQAVAAGKTGDKIRLMIFHPTASAVTWWIDGAQVEKVAYPTPYINTSAGTVLRGSPRVQAPSSVLSLSQGWVAARVRMGYTNTQALTNSNTALFTYWDDTNNRTSLGWVGVNAGWQTRMLSGGVTNTVLTKADTFNPGDFKTLIYAWDANFIYLSLNGSIFSKTARAVFPSYASPTFDIGSAGTLFSNPANADFLWFAAGKGTLADSDAATINGFGNIDTSLDSFPGAPSFFWPAATAVATISSDPSRPFRITGQLTSSDTQDIRLTGQATSAFRTASVTNILSNGGMEVDTSSWAANAAGVVTLTRDTGTVFAGSGSLKVVMDGTATTQGAFTTTANGTASPNVSLTASVMVLAPVGANYILEINARNAAGSSLQTGTIGFTGTGQWQSVAGSFTPSDANTARGGIKVRQSGATGRAETIYIDNAQLEVTQSGSPFPYVNTQTGIATQQFIGLGQDIRVIGNDTTFITQVARVTGQLTDSSLINFRTVAQDAASATRDLRIAGQLSSTMVRDFRASAQDTASLSREFRVSAQDTTAQSLDFRASAQDTATLTREFRATAQDLTSLTQSLRITGKTTISFDSRTVYFSIFGLPIPEQGTRTHFVNRLKGNPTTGGLRLGRRSGRLRS